jgi:hypothetical protein
MEIKNLFKMNFEKEIEAVIKIGEYSEKNATEEINNYIVTEQIADRIDKFIDYYDTPHREETGVWLSGFYGSGKSYLAKVIGYLLSNPSLMGVEARKLFINRLTGLEDKALLENKIQGLSNIKTKTVLFDLSGESLNGTFYKKLLLNFLKSIGLPKNYIGYIEFQIMKAGKYDDFLEIANSLSMEKTGKGWNEVRTNKVYAPSIIKDAWIKILGEESIDMTQIHNSIENIDADELISELDAFLNINKNFDRIIFIIDEVSEAIDKEHVELTELRGLAQHLSQDEKSRFWFIATAQEKLDNVLSRKAINQNDINILTDRFQLKIHLSSAQVDKVIKERVLAKNEEGKRELERFYDNNNGALSSISNLEGKFDTQIKSKEEFIEYYPFYNYQMKLLKNFLYSVFQQAQSGGSERGMLVTVDRLLKNENIYGLDIGHFVSGHQLCDYGFPMPQSELEEKYSKAKEDLGNEFSMIDGSKLLKTIFFLEKSEDLKRNDDNIAKLYNNELTYIGDIKDNFTSALEFLESKNHILKENGEYKITNDIEENLMREMGMIDENWEERVDIVRKKIKELSFITNFSTYRLDNKTYNITIQDEEKVILSTKKGDVRLIIYNVLSLDDDLENQLNIFKEKYIDLDTAVLVPEIKYKKEINERARKIYKYEIIISRNRNTTDEDKKKVIDSFETISANLMRELETYIQDSYYNSYLIYDFNEKTLNKNNMVQEVNEILGKMIDKTYSKRLKETLPSNAANKLLTVSNRDLSKYCTKNQFNFFDTEGTFIGNDLLVVKEIDRECSSKDGRRGDGLLDTFTSKPYGWETENIIATLAALIRAGNLKVRSEGNDYRIYTASKVKSIFSNTNEFKSSKFYTIIGGGLSSTKKQRIVESLLEIDINDKLKDNDFNLNDFQVVENISTLADEYNRKYENLKSKVDDNIIKKENEDTSILKDFASREVDDNNIVKIADEFLEKKDEFKSIVKHIDDLEKFIDREYDTYKKKSKFIKDVKEQLEEDSSEIKEEILRIVEEFEKRESDNVINNLPDLNQKFIEIRQKFNELFSTHFKLLKETSNKLIKAAVEKKLEIEKISIKANGEYYRKLDEYISENKKIEAKEFNLSENEAKDLSTGYNLREVKLNKKIKEVTLSEIEEFVPEPEEKKVTGVEKKEKTYEAKIKKETKNILYIKDKLKEILDELDNEEYDKVKITLL